MFVKLDHKNVNINNIIAKIRFGLHPSFGVDHVDVKANPEHKFEMTFNGYGTFMIPAKIHFKRETGLAMERRIIDLEHGLSFEGKGKWRTVTIPIPKASA